MEAPSYAILSLSYLKQGQLLSRFGVAKYFCPQALGSGLETVECHKQNSSNLQDGLWGPWKQNRGYTQVFWVCPGVWIPNQGYIQVFECALAFGSPTGATYRRLDPKPRLHTGVWSPNRGYTWVFGVPNQGYTRVFGVPNRRSCKLPVLVESSLGWSCPSRHPK